MKKILIAIAVFICNHTSAQIVLDTIVNPWNAVGYDFYPVKISSNETKYYVQDTLTNTFNLYNLDFTPFLLNIAVPESYSPFTKNMEVIYLSRTLFDCDSSNIEYAYTAIGTGYNPFYIMRTDGTQIFKKDSALAPYLFGTLNGSLDIKPIFNTEEGAKLFLYAPKNSNNLHIYSLCGKLPPSIYLQANSLNISLNEIQVIPNPSTGTVNFKISLPDNIRDYKLVIINDSGQQISTQKLDFEHIDNFVDFSTKSSGVYFYSVVSNNSVIRSGKLSILK